MEQVNTGIDTPENTPAPEGHDDKMIEAVDQKEQTLNQIDQSREQEKILGKFDSQADLEKAYEALEKKLGEKAQDNQEQDGKETDGEMDEAKASDLIQKANVDIQSIADHYYANGGLADSHYEELEKAGISKAYVDQYISGVEAEGEQMRDALFTEVGGEDTFKAMSDWAVSNLSEQELSAYNDSIDSGNFDTVRSAVMSLAYRFEKSMGKDPNLVSGNGQTTSGNRFESVAQLTEAMKDPRYHSDPAYRNEVEQRLARSSIL